MPVVVKLFWSKTCPICKMLLEEVLLPLQRVMPDILVVQYVETFPRFVWSGFLVQMPSTLYYTTFGKTAEVIVDDSRYLLYKASYIVVYKFFKKVLYPKLLQEIESRNMSIYRKVFLKRKLLEVLKNLKKKAKEEKALLESLGMA